MTEQQNTQIDALAGQLVTHQRCLADLSVEDRQWAFQNPKDALALFCDAVKNRAAKVADKKPTLIFLKKTALGSTSITTYGLGQRLTIAQMLRARLKLADDVPLDVIEKLANKRKHAVSSASYEGILDKQAKFFLKQEGGEDFGLRDDGWANLILVENADGSLSVEDARWHGSGWDRGRDSLVHARVWYRGHRLVVSNSDASNL